MHEEQPGQSTPEGQHAAASGSGQWQPATPPPAGAQGPWAATPPSGPQGPWGSSGQGQWTGTGSWPPPPPPGAYGQPAEPPRPPRRGRALRYIPVAILAAALGAGAVLAVQGGSLLNGSSDNSGVSAQQIPAPPGNSDGNTNTSAINTQAVAGKVEPGVVDITSTVRLSGEVFEGTGIVLSSSGLVLTNNHVVNGSTGLTATLVTSGHRYTAQIVGTDARDDVALIKLVGASGLTPVQVGNSDGVVLGTQVVALGNAGGTGGTPTVTSGAITALDRTITAGNSGSGTSETLHGMLQTNAPIAEGDSGGPLANAAGQVIGMDTAANTQSLGGPGTSQGFAIPINRALAIARLMAAGHATSAIRIGQPAFMGVAVAGSPSNGSAAITPQQQLQQLQQQASGAGGGFGGGGGTNGTGSCLVSDSSNPVPSQIAPASSGTLIAGVFCGTPAERAGLTGGDVIQGVNGQTVTAPATLTKVLSHYHPGDTISVTWVGLNGQSHTGSLTLIAGPAK